VPSLLSPGITGAILALAWLAGLWFAAPLIDPDERDVGDRIRNTILLGVAIPFGLAFLGIFSAWSASALLAAAGIARRRLRAATLAAPEPALLAVLAAVPLFLWPQLVHPVLEGDSLAYHLPNAAAWAQSHSVWQTNAREWFYPGASELFAAPFFVFGARFSLPLCGSLPALLLMARITIWGRELGARTLEAGLCAIALVATPIAAYEVGTLQNDVWLAAFFVETLFVLRSRRGWTATAVTSLLKPVGFAYAAIAFLVTRRLDVRALLAFLPLGLWLVRDAVLLPSAQVAVESDPNYWATTIVANLWPTIGLLGSGLRYAGYATPLFLALPFVGLAFPKIRFASIGGCLAAVLFSFLPHSYFGNINYVAAGTSFRYALPAMACGALVLCAITARLRWLGIAIAGLASLCGITVVMTVFWNDGWAAPVALGITPLCIAAVFFDRTRQRYAAIVIGAMVVVAAAPLAQTRAAGFFQDWMRGPSGAPTHAFDWIALHRPERLAVWNVGAGSVLLMSPGTRTVEASDSVPCETAKTERALLFAGTDRDLPAVEQARRRGIARACGNVVYDDDAALIVQPR
jgi:hypothetical protein